MKRDSSIFYIAIVTFFIFLSSVAMAQGGKIRLGYLSVIPGLSLQSVHDDNIFLTDRAEESDWITHIRPEILFDYPLYGARGNISLGYRGNFAYYSDNSDNEWQAHMVPFSLNYNAPGGLIIGIDNTYTVTEDPYANEDTEQYRIGEKTKRWHDALKTQFGYQLGVNSKVLLYYNYSKQDYDRSEDDSQDYDSNEFGVGFEMKFLPKTWGFIRYHYGSVDFFSSEIDSKDSDYDWHRVNTGITWDSGAKLSGELNIGYTWKTYDNELDLNNLKYEDQDSWIAATSVDFTATSTTTFSFNVSRALRESGSDTKKYFEDTDFEIGLNQQLLAKVSLRADLGYSFNDYNVDDREDDNYRAGIGIDYKVQDWLGIGVGYAFKEKNSNIDSNDYTNNQFMLNINATY